MKKIVLASSFIALFLAVNTIVAQAQESSTTIGGYGELHYNEPEGSTKGQLDFHRFVIYLNHEFNDWIGFYSETELEHTLSGEGESGGIVALEQAYLELRTWKALGFRAGILLAPVGIINQVHEPPTFNGVERPRFHSIILPTTWREAGLGIFGHVLDNLNYQLYVMSSFKAEGFTASNGLRGGRQRAFNASTADMALTGRVEYMPLLGLNLGASFFTGGVTGGNDILGDAAVTVLAGDLRYGIGNLNLRGEAAMISIADADRINAVFGKSVADQLNGYYFEAAYNILPHLAAETEQQLHLFGRYEKNNTQAEVTGFTASEANDRTDITVGLTYKPVSNVVFKIDYQIFDDARDTDARGQFNAGIGYAFY
jgi:hypothetical protein